MMDPRPPATTFTARRHSRARGSALVYVTSVMVALLAFTSLAVDLGRVYVVKSELQLAADAAARYAAAGFKDGITVAQDNAINAADDNAADGSAVLLDRNADIEFGTWVRPTFTPLSGPARSAANAVRVTARRTTARGNPVQLMFARVIGRPTLDAEAVSIARVAVTPFPGGFIGTSSLSVGNNAIIASYDPAAGAPGGSNVSSSVTIGSNAQVQVGNNTSLRGDVVSPDFEIGNGSSVTGQQNTNYAPLTYPPTELPAIASSGALDLPAHTTMTLPAGTYLYSSIKVGQDATLTFSGTATVYVTGNVTLGQKAKIEGAGDDPGALRLRMAGVGTSFQAGNNAVLIANLYAPGADVVFGNNAHVRGSVVASTIEFGNNAELYFDPKSSGGLTGATVTTLA